MHCYSGRSGAGRAEGGVTHLPDPVVGRDHVLRDVERDEVLRQVHPLVVLRHALQHLCAAHVCGDSAH